ncbi:hypothetical protein PINS_up024220 [Pythium insidiosum]|nr:hypothetical protein PINS_up024220 [Pythium insidiosum]
MAPCQVTNLKQRFVYNSTTLQLRLDRTTQCLDDGGATSPGSTALKMSPCSAGSPHQMFIYDTTKRSFQNPTKTNLCIDASAKPMRLLACDAASVNQSFDIKSV